MSLPRPIALLATWSLAGFALWGAVSLSSGLLVRGEAVADEAALPASAAPVQIVALQLPEPPPPPMTGPVAAVAPAVSAVAHAPTHIVAAVELNVRAEPSKSGAPLSTLPRGAEVIVDAGGTGWARIVLPDGSTGWVSERFLTPIGMPSTSL